jgi:hypothetical protein
VVLISYLLPQRSSEVLLHSIAMSCSRRWSRNIKRKRWVVNAKMQRYTIWRGHYLKSTVELPGWVVWVIKSERFAQGLWGPRHCSRAAFDQLTGISPPSKRALISHEYGESTVEVTAVHTASFNCRPLNRHQVRLRESIGIVFKLKILAYYLTKN